MMKFIWLVFAVVAFTANQIGMMFLMLLFAAVSWIIGKTQRVNSYIEYNESQKYRVGEMVHYDEIRDPDQLCPPSFTTNGIIVETDKNNPNMYYVRYIMNGHGRYLKKPIEKHQSSNVLRKGWSVNHELIYSEEEDLA